MRLVHRYFHNLWRPAVPLGQRVSECLEGQQDAFLPCLVGAQRGESREGLGGLALFPTDRPFGLVAERGDAGGVSTDGD